MRDSFDICEIIAMQWIPGGKKLAAALTNRIILINDKLNKEMRDGNLNTNIFEQVKRVASL